MQAVVVVVRVRIVVVVRVRVVAIIGAIISRSRDKEEWVRTRQELGQGRMGKDQAGAEARSNGRRQGKSRSKEEWVRTRQEQGQGGMGEDKAGAGARMNG